MKVHSDIFSKILAKYFKKENEKLNKLRYILDENLIQKYSLMIESPLYNNVEDIISDIMYFENKRKKYTK